MTGFTYWVYILAHSGEGDHALNEPATAGATADRLIGLRAC